MSTPTNPASSSTTMAAPQPRRPPGPPPVVQRRRPNESGGLFRGKKKNIYTSRVASGTAAAGANTVTGGSQGTQNGSQGAVSGSASGSGSKTIDPASVSSSGRAITPIPTRLDPNPRPTPGTPSGTHGRNASGSGSLQGSPRTSNTAGSTSQARQTQTPTQAYQDYPIYLLPRVPSTNPSALTDPLLRALPFPTSLNILHIRHPGSATLPLPDLSSPAGKLFLNRKDPSAPPPPDPRILQERNEERERIAAVKTPVKQDDGTWRVRMWDWAQKGEKKDENGEVVWKEAADPALIAPDLSEKAPVESNKKWKGKNGKKKFGKKGGAGVKYGARGGGGGKGQQGEGRVNVKMREQALMYRLHDGRHDLPSDTESGEDSSEDENGDRDRADEVGEQSTSTSKKGKKKPSTNNNNNEDEEKKTKDRKIKGKTYKRTMAIANARNREKNPFVLEGHFGTEPMVPVVPPPGPPVEGEEPRPTEERQKLRYVSNAISDVKDRYVALLFNKSKVGLRWVGREYTLGVRVEEKREEREGYEGGRRWGPRGARRPPVPAAGAGGNPAQAQAAAEAAAAAVAGDVDMELYRPTSAGSGVDIKPHLQDTGDNPDAFPRMYASGTRGGTDIKPKIEQDVKPDLDRGRGRGRDVKTGSLLAKLKLYEQADYSYAKQGSGKDIDNDAAERIIREKQRGRVRPQKWEDDDDERGRRGGVGRGDVERGAGEDWDVENEGEQDDEEEVLINAEDQEFARERDARLKEDYDLANANVGLLQRDEAEDSDEDDIFGERAEAKRKLAKREKKLKRKYAGDNSSEDDSESGEESDSSSDESDVTAPTEEEDVKPDIKALEAATSSPTKDKGKQRSDSPSVRKASSPAPPIKRESSPAGSSGRALSIDRGAGHAMAARRALSPAGSRSSVEPGSASRGKKRKGPPAQNTAPPESGGGRPLTPLSKKARANTEGPSPPSSGVSTPVATDFAMQSLDAPVVSGTGGPASSATGHTPTPLKKHKARGKKNKNGTEGSETPRSSSVSAGRMGSPAPSSSRNASPAPSGSRRPQSRAPKESSVPPQDLEAEKARLRIADFAGAITAKMIHDILVSNGRPLTGAQLWQGCPTGLSADQTADNQARLKSICKYFCHRTRLENGQNYTWNENERV